MTIVKRLNGTQLTVAPEGRLDANTAPELDNALTNSLNGVTELIIDFERVNYISSAGLRVLLAAQLTMNKQGSMKIIHVSETIRELFEVTGFSDYLTLE